MLVNKTNSGHVSIAFECTDMEYCITAIVGLEYIRSSFNKHCCFAYVIYPHWLQQSSVPFKTISIYETVTAAGHFKH